MYTVVLAIECDTQHGAELVRTMLAKSSAYSLIVSSHKWTCDIESVQEPPICDPTDLTQFMVERVDR